MPLDPSVKPLLEYWIRQQKEAERHRDRALADGKLWFNRAKLALSVGRMEMASEAKGRALEARERYERARLRLEIIATERELLRTDPANLLDVAAAARERRQHAMHEFQRLGIDPGFALDVPDPLADAAGDGAVLQRLRERMNADRAGVPAGTAARAGDAPEAASHDDLAAAEAEIAAELESDIAGPAGQAPERPAAPPKRFETIGED